MADERRTREGRGTPVRVWASRILLAANFVLFLSLAWLFVWRGAILSPPWDGPAVATVALTAAAIILAAVGVGVGLLAIWGYTTLREHAANVAERAAEAAADEAADRRVQRLLKDWGLSSDGEAGEEVAKAYEKE